MNELNPSPDTAVNNPDSPPIADMPIVAEETLTESQLAEIKAFINPKHQAKIVEAAYSMPPNEPLSWIASSGHGDALPPYRVIQSPAITWTTLTSQRCLDALKETKDKAIAQNEGYFNLIFAHSGNDKGPVAIVTFVGEEGQIAFNHLYYHPDEIDTSRITEITDDGIRISSIRQY